MAAPEKTPLTLTQAQQIRLECLRLVYHPAKDAQYLITKVVEFERYIADGKPGEPPSAAETERQDGPNAPL